MDRKQQTRICLEIRRIMKERIENIMTNGFSFVSDWEKGFLGSIFKQLDSGRISVLSSAQLSTLHRIEAKIEKLKKGDPEWEAEWDENKMWKWGVAIKYYDSGIVRYYSQVLDWAEKNPGKIPPRNFYQRVVENKYAQRIINELKTPGKYKEGDTVTFRATARTAIPYREYTKFAGKPLFVIEVTNRVEVAAKGARVYRVLSSDSSDVLELEERYIKKWKVPKNAK